MDNLFHLFSALPMEYKVEVHSQKHTWHSVPRVAFAANQCFESYECIIMMIHFKGDETGREEDSIVAKPKHR